MPISREQLDVKALATLDAFKKEVEALGLYGSFDTPARLKDQVRRDVESDIVALDLAEPVLSRGSARRGASLRAVYSSAKEPDSKGRMRTKRQRITITNTGDTEATDRDIHTPGTARRARPPRPSAPSCRFRPSPWPRTGAR